MIFIQNESGLCKGLINTLNVIYEVYENNSDKNNNIYIYNYLINNNKVIEELESLNIQIIDDISIVSKDDIVIINSYGLSNEVMQYIKDNKINYIDTSCKYLKDFKELVIESYNKGNDILIINNKYSNLINNWINNNGIIINDLNDLDSLDQNKDKLLVAYLYFDENKILEYKDYLTKNYNNNKIEYLIHNCSYSKKLNELMNENKLTKKIIIAQQNEEIDNSINNYNDFINYVLKSDLKKDMDITLIGSMNTTIKELYRYKYLLAFLLFYKDKLQVLKENQDNFNNNLKDNKDNALVDELLNSIIYLNKDGKYIRATLISLGEYLSGSKESNYLDLAYAYELFQTSVLIHDDIIDNAKLRRGKSTIPHTICNLYLNKQNNPVYHKDTLKLANSLAICAGDLGFYLANKIIINNYYNHPHFNELINFYNDIIIKTIKGEIIDVYIPFLSKYNYYNSKEQDILDIYHLKTSWYTIIGPFILGYLLGNKDIHKNLETTLNKIGLAFQIKDDLLGIFGDSKVIGKPNVSDIEEFKQTILYSYIINTEYKEEFLKLYGKKNITSKELFKIRELLISSGAFDYTNNYLNDLYDDALNGIDELEISEEGKDILKGLLVFILEREK